MAVVPGRATLAASQPPCRAAHPASSLGGRSLRGVADPAARADLGLVVARLPALPALPAALPAARGLALLHQAAALSRPPCGPALRLWTGDTSRTAPAGAPVGPAPPPAGLLTRGQAALHHPLFRPLTSLASIGSSTTATRHRSSAAATRHKVSLAVVLDRTGVAAVLTGKEEEAGAAAHPIGRAALRPSRAIVACYVCPALTGMTVVPYIGCLTSAATFVAGVGRGGTKYRVAKDGSATAQTGHSLHRRETRLGIPAQQTG